MSTPTTLESRPHYSVSADALFVFGGLAIGCSAANFVPGDPALVVVVLASCPLSALLAIWARMQVRNSNGLVRGSRLAARSIAGGC